jgi:hypothetical protein
MKTPLEKAIVGVVQIHDETIVIIDEDRLNREVLKGSIANRDVQKLLPFQTAIGVGDTYYHIVNASAYLVETNCHTIYEGETLCKRFGNDGWSDSARFALPTCPGCLAKAKALIVHHLLKTEPELS